MAKSIKPRTFWTEQEESIIKDKYPTATYTELLELLPSRTKMSIKQRARILGVARKPQCRRCSYITAKYNRNREFFTTLNLLNCYWAGFIAADGGIDYNHHRLYIKLSATDHEHLEQFKEDTKFEGPIKRFWEESIKGTNEFSKIVIDSAADWIDDLDNWFNIKQGKTHNLIGPNLDPNSDLALAFIAGYIDGDGSITVSDVTIKGNQYRQLDIKFTGTKDILYWINSALLLQYPIQTSRLTNIKPLINTKVVESLNISGYRAQVILEKMKTFDLPLLSRKWDKTNGLVIGALERKRAPNNRQVLYSY